MFWKAFSTCALATVAMMALPTPAKALDPVTIFLGEYLLGKVLDEGWDAVTGKPDIKLLDRRLKELQANAVLRGEMRDEIQKLRDGLNERVTRDEFRTMADRAKTEIGSIQRRLTSLEERVEMLEVEKEDAKNKTTNATDAGYFKTRVWKHDSDKNYYQAIACCNIAICLEPSYLRYVSYWVRGEMYLKLKAYELTVVDETEAIRLCPMDHDPYYIRAVAYKQLGDYDRAISDASTAIRLKPDRARFHNIRGIAYAFKKDWDLAITDYTEVIRLNAKNGWVDLSGLDPVAANYVNNRGVAYSWKKDYNRAIADFTEAIRLDSTFVEAYRNRAYSYEANGDKEKAAADRAQAEKIKK